VRRRLAALVAGIVAVIGGFGAYLALSGDDAPPPPHLPGRATAEAAPAVSRWTVAAGSFAGYRVDEEYLGVGVKTAVGRTTAVSGRIELEHERVVDATLEADLSRLRSDQSRRDDALRTRGIETARYPTARFSLRGPAALRARARGLLSLHGRRAPITVTVEGRIAGGRLELVGSAPIDFEDFAIEPPSVAGLVSVRSHGTLEFRLVARRG
jgi:polyisoprenoid-binding protein YceI